MKKKIENYINHIFFVLDESSSMGVLTRQVVKVFDEQIKYLATRSKELNQETRVSVYFFSDRSNVNCAIWDMDVLRVPSLASYYQPYGNTALRDGTMLAIKDSEKIPQIYGDHGYLFYVLTDGAENDSATSQSELIRKLDGLPENYTVAALVPDATGIHEAKQAGFPANNIQVWSTTEKGVESVGETIRVATDSYMRARATGVRGTKTLFNLDTANLTKNVVKNALEELKPSEYDLFPVSKDCAIKPFIESWTKQPYRPGSAYYPLTKKEKIQFHKQICVQDKRNGKLYSGTNARKLLGLPDHEVTVGPSSSADYFIFVQSTSLNRKLLGGTTALLLK